MNGEIFLLNNDELVTLAEQPYGSEELLQKLVAEHPHVLAGDQINPDAPRRWLLIRREQPLADEADGSGRWSMDHLFVDQDGIPTLVEVKRRSDTRIRREVVGQMLDYAANAVAYLSIEKIQANFAYTCELQKREPEDVLADFLGPDVEIESFWQAIKTNLQAGRLRLLFVADQIPKELRRIVEFLNAQMDPAEVLAVELKQFVGQSLRTLVPRVIGHTAEAERKQVGRRATKQWDETSFFKELERRHGVDDVSVARSVLAWADARFDRRVYGSGARSGSITPVIDSGGFDVSFFSLWTTGGIALNFEYLSRRPPFDDEELRAELVRKFGEVPGVSLATDALNTRPSFAYSPLRDEAARTKFCEAVEWAICQVRGTGATQEGMAE